MKTMQTLLKVLVATLSVSSVLCGNLFAKNTLVLTQNERDSNQINTAPPPESENTHSQDKDDTNLQKIQLGKSTATAEREFESYQSGAQISQDILQNSPSGNGDITSILKILPNVQFDNAQNKSTTPGEIDPANISISGGLFYQNNFQLDGFNVNNDLDPAGGTTNGPTTLRGGRSQGLNIDTSLLDNITVQDSNISAAYGKFTGGVVEAQVRKPRRDSGGINGWHANISYQHTSNHLTQYHIHQDQEANFATSADENYQPRFSKHLIKSSVEGYLNENLGLIASFNTTQSFIPLQAFGNFMGAGEDAKKTREQKRQSYNYYAKVFYNPSENFTLEANIAYMPQFNTYYHALAKDSYYAMQSGGLQAGLKALSQTSMGLWSNQIGYSRLENSRRSDTNYWLSWFVSDEKNWAYSPTAAIGFARANEGGYGDIDELQNTLNYKSDFAFSPLNAWRTAHNFRVGFDLDYQKLGKNRLNPYYGFNNPAALIQGTSCPNAPDSFGIWSCSNVRPKDQVPATNPTFNQLGWGANWNTIVGQYFNTLTFYLPKGNVEFDNFAYGLFAEDDIGFDLGKGGEINTRLGLRFDGDNYMSKQSLAPRFSFNYITPASPNWRTKLTIGANRYYGRNLFSYRFYDYLNSSASQWTRPSPNDAWVESTNSAAMVYSTYKFSKLKVPYSDELMGGITQNLGIFSATLKYIYRDGKDEIMQMSRNDLKPRPPLEPGYGYGTNGGNYTTWTNDGKSQSHIISFIVQNTKLIQTYGITHNYLFAFDYTQVNRGYNIYGTDSAYYDDNDVVYNGQIIKYRDRPVDNYARPWTLRLNTTHAFNIGKTKWLLNNFLRYRAKYERVVRLYASSAGYDPSLSQYTQYGKMDFKGAFSWDMRVGFEYNVYKIHTLYVNVDIYNVLNARNMTTIGNSDGAIAGASSSSIATTSNNIPVYEIGRQFWLQVGYKF